MLRLLAIGGAAAFAAVFAKNNFTSSGTPQLQAVAVPIGAGAALALALGSIWKG